MEKNKCEKCGHVMVEYETDTCEGMRCPNCGWGWVTTLFNPIELDQTIYTVKFDIIANPSKEQLKTVSKMLNVNFLVTAKLLKDGNASFSGTALEIKNKANDLKKSNIHYSISPDFQYEI